jgi:hypothetical protein
VRARGGATLLMALAILAIMTAAAFAVHRSVLREWALEGEALQGERAALAADSALGWVLDRWADRPVETEFAVPGEVFPPQASGRAWLLCLGEGPPGTRRLWKVTVEGRIQPPGRSVPYRQVREAYVAEGEGTANPEVWAWRIVR